MANWESVSRLVVAALQGNATLTSYSKITLVDSVADYLKSAAGQAVNEAYLVLVSPPTDAESYRHENLINGVKRKFFYFELAIVVKNEPSGVKRLYGERGKGIYEVQDDVQTVLEHNNFSGQVDNKAGSNFEGGWSKAGLDNRAITAYTTTYTVVKTE